MQNDFTDISEVQNYTQIFHFIPLQGYRIYVAVSYIIFNIIGFVVNSWVLYVVFPLLFAPSIKVPKSILFYIMTLCFSDLFVMIGMVFLISDFLFGTWMFSEKACTTYLIFDSLNKFIAPIIALLLSRTCYATVCLNKTYRDRAANLKYASLQVAVCLIIIMVVLWPVFAYTGVVTFYFSANHTEKSVLVMRKCNFQPPPRIELGFNIVACISNYAIPLGGILYWYMSVPFFLRKRAETTLIGKTGISETAIKKIITTALVLMLVFLLCWSPYYIFLFAHKKLSTILVPRTLVIVSYFIHLLPYISCSAYPMIFTLMNRAIQVAHAQMIRNQRRRFRSMTDDATRHFRHSLRYFGRTLALSRNPSSNRLSGNNVSKSPVPPTSSTNLNTSLMSPSVSDVLFNEGKAEIESLDLNTVPFSPEEDTKSDKSEIRL